MVGLWAWTFFALLVTSIFGIWLFAGFTFRLKPRYPFLLVTCHVVGALVTVVLFCSLFIKWLYQPQVGHSFAPAILWVGLIMILATFLSGLYFYFFFNARRRGLGYKLLITHLVMAALSFVFVVASIAELSGSVHTQHLFPGTKYNFYKHHRSQRATYNKVP